MRTKRRCEKSGPHVIFPHPLGFTVTLPTRLLTRAAGLHCAHAAMGKQVDEETEDEDEAEVCGLAHSLAMV